MSRLHVLSGKFLHGKSCCPKSFRFFWLWAFIIDAINQFRTEVIIHQRSQPIKTLPSALTKKKTFCRSNHNYRFLHKSWSKFSIKISVKLHHQNFDWLQLQNLDKFWTKIELKKLFKTSTSTFWPNLSFKILSSNFSKNSHVLPTGQWYAPSAVINDALIMQWIVQCRVQCTIHCILECRVKCKVYCIMHCTEQ